MFRTILVPLDGSSFAEAALPTAEAMATSFQGQLVLLHVVPVPEHVLTANGHVVSYLAYGRQAYTVERQVKAHVARARDYLNRIASRLGIERSSIELDVRVGPPAEAISAASRDHESSLVVMASHGRAGLSRWFRGSVAGEVLHDGSTPLLLVRPAEEAEDQRAA